MVEKYEIVRDEKGIKKIHTKDKRDKNDNKKLYKKYSFDKADRKTKWL